jgi:hypothetical protein
MKLEKCRNCYHSGLLTGVFCFLFSLGVQAQLRVGPKAGIQMGRSVFEDEDYRREFTSSFKPGLLAGVILNYRVNKTYSLHSELFYNQKGKNVSNRDNSGQAIQNKAVYQYVDLPVMLRISGHQQGSRKLEYYFNIGPSFNYWLGGRGTLRHPELYDTYNKFTIPYQIRFEEENEVKNYGQNLYVKDVNRLQMSLDFGVGIIMDLGRGHGVMIDLRNSLGVGKSFMGERESGDFGLQVYNDNFEAVNHVFSLSVGYLLDIDVPALLMKGRRMR